MQVKPVLLHLPVLPDGSEVVPGMESFMKAPATNVGANGGRSAILLPGFGAGLLGGIAMAAWMIASAALDGMEPLAALRPMGDTFAGAEPRGGGPGVVLYGLTLHMLFAGAVGILFTIVLPRDLEPRLASVLCIGSAFGVMAVMTSFVLPAYNPSLRAEMPELGGSWVLAHAAYGATVGFFAQKLRHRRRATETEQTGGREPGQAPPPGERSPAARR